MFRTRRCLAGRRVPFRGAGDRGGQLRFTTAQQRRFGHREPPPRAGTSRDGSLPPSPVVRDVGLPFGKDLLHPGGRDRDLVARRWAPRPTPVAGIVGGHPRVGLSLRAAAVSASFSDCRSANAAAIRAARDAGSTASGGT